MSVNQESQNEEEQRIVLNNTNSKLLKRIKHENKKFYSHDFQKNKQDQHVIETVKKIIINSQSTTNFLKNSQFLNDFSNKNKQFKKANPHSIGSYFKLQSQKNSQDLQLSQQEKYQDTIKNSQFLLNKKRSNLNIHNPSELQNPSSILLKEPSTTKINNIYYNNSKETISNSKMITKSGFMDNYSSLGQTKNHNNYLQNNQDTLELAKGKKKIGQIKQSAVMDNGSQINISQFAYINIVGKGGFGKVWKVELKKNKQFFALKQMSKARIISKKSVHSVMNERNLLSQLKHPFLVNMNFAFQDRENLYLVMDLLTGGDLRYHIARFRRFSEVQTQFFVACILQSLFHMHNNQIIHRDIKPENLVLDKDGYVRVTDLGIARQWQAENSQDTSGTPGYMAPEVMCRQNHSYAVDYYAVGVIVYEFMLGRRPYVGRSRKDIRDQILAKQVQIKRSEIPHGWSVEAADFANRLLQRKPQNRLGSQGPNEILQHPWMKNYPWKKLIQKELDAPFIPGSVNNHIEFSQMQSEEQNLDTDVIQQNNLLLRKKSVQSLFSGYNYDICQIQKSNSTGSTNDTQYNTLNTLQQDISYIMK